MNPLFLMKNPDLFQGEKYLKNHQSYFEGWYFKNTKKDDSISFIPGINIDSLNRKAFIQIITKTASYFVDYPINDFQFGMNPFYVRIGNSIFSKEGIYIDIKDNAQDLRVSGNINYSRSENIKTSFFNPNIMGPFSYIPNMECNHAILCMKNKTDGLISLNGKEMNFNDGIGYIEKDWGCSFPKSYIWCQGNHFQNSDASFMLSIANIPFRFFAFTGIICVLKIGNKELKFTTYNNTKLREYNVDDINVTLKKGSYLFNIKSQSNSGLKLTAPVKGKMEKEIKESISSTITVTLRKENQVIFSDTSNNCGLEVVKEDN